MTRRARTSGPWARSSSTVFYPPHHPFIFSCCIVFFCQTNPLVTASHPVFGSFLIALSLFSFSFPPLSFFLSLFSSNGFFPEVYIRFIKELLANKRPRISHIGNYVGYIIHFFNNIYGILNCRCITVFIK